MDIDIEKLAKTVAESLNLKDFKGDVVGVKVVENQFDNVEPGGIGIQNNYYNNTQDATPQTESDNKPLPSFCLSSEKQKHWVDVYSRLKDKRWLKKNDVSQQEFLYIMCAVGNRRYKPIPWHGTTNALAYIVRNKLKDGNVDKWEIATKVFYDKNGKPLPPSFPKSKQPGKKTVKSIDEIFKE